MHGLSKTLSSGGNDEVFLEGELVSGVTPTVDDIEAGDGHGVFLLVVSCKFGEMSIEREFVGGGSSLCGGKRDSKDGCDCGAKTKKYSEKIFILCNYDTKTKTDFLTIGAHV